MSQLRTDKTDKRPFVSFVSALEIVKSAGNGLASTQGMPILKSTQHNYIHRGSRFSGFTYPLGTDKTDKRREGEPCG